MTQIDEKITIKRVFLNPVTIAACGTAIGQTLICFGFKNGKFSILAIGIIFIIAFVAICTEWYETKVLK
jgi:hypothetical protein